MSGSVLAEETAESGQADYLPARLSTRLAARAIDALITALWAPVGLSVGFLVIAMLIALTGAQSTSPTSGFAAVAVVGFALSAASIVAYEPLCTARWGQTLGKRMMSLRVTSHPARRVRAPSLRRCLVRWAVPHGAFALAAIAANAVAAARGWWALPMWLGAGVMAWTAAHGSVLLDPQRRGWHDRRAGTIVISSGDDHRGSDAEHACLVTRRSALAKLMAAVLVAAVSLGAGTAVSAGMYGLRNGFGAFGG